MTTDYHKELEELISHPRFISIERVEINGPPRWEVTHKNDCGCEASICGSNLANLLTVWGSLLEKWSPL